MTPAPRAQLSILDTYKKGEPVEVMEDATHPRDWTTATVVRVNRARQVVIVSLWGRAGTRSYPTDRVRRPPPPEAPKPKAPKPPKKAAEFTPLSWKKPTGGGASHKFQTFAPYAWRQEVSDVISSLEKLDGITGMKEGEAVRLLLRLGLDMAEGLAVDDLRAKLWEIRKAGRS